MQVQATRVEYDFVTEKVPPKRINAFRGGARSSKTHSILSIAANWLSTGYVTENEYHPKGKFFILRATMPALRASAYKEFTEILHDRNVYKFVEHRRTEFEFTFQGRTVRFFSTDDLNSEKLRGQQSTFFYLNEANTISYDAFNQLIMRCEVFCFLDYNPAGIQNWCKTHIEETRLELGDVRLDVSTYMDNPFIPSEMVEEIENYANTDPDYYEVYTKGNWIQLRNLVFNKYELCEYMPEDYDKRYYGLDFGWNDPTTCVEVRIKGKQMYIKELFYEQHMTIPEMADAIFSNDVKKVYCDHEPRTIKHLKSLGVQARKATKGRDSIEQGLNFIRQHEVFLYHKSQNLIREWSSYRYKEDRDGEVTDKPMDKDNHTPDAVRMACSTALRTKVELI
jgi:phage terminase large subunit